MNAPGRMAQVRWETEIDQTHPPDPGQGGKTAVLCAEAVRGASERREKFAVIARSALGLR